MLSLRRILPLTFVLLMLPSLTSAATLYLDPSSGTYGPGDTFVVNVRLDTKSDGCVNAANIEVAYPKQTLRAADFSRGGSIFTLWISEPQFDLGEGKVIFSGGIPGGYCGRIPGDPAVSNILGKIVFTVISSTEKSAAIQFTPASVLYLNDGLGTKISPALTGSRITIVSTSTLGSNPWLVEVGADTVAPDPFTIQVESTRGVFGGRYYIVFSTVDKQSGLDHYEIYENGAWKKITTPYELRDQSLRGDIQVKAIDKAGNERLGAYTRGSAPPRQYSIEDFLFPSIALIILVVGLSVHFYRRRKTSHDGDVVDLRT